MYTLKIQRFSFVKKHCTVIYQSLRRSHHWTALLENFDLAIEKLGIRSTSKARIAVLEQHVFKARAHVAQVRHAFRVALTKHGARAPNVGHVFMKALMRSPFALAHAREDIRCGHVAGLCGSQQQELELASNLILSSSLFSR